MFEPNSLLWSVAYLQAVCLIVCAIGGVLGLRLPRLLPAVLAAGLIGAALMVIWQLRQGGGAGGSLWQQVEHELAQFPARLVGSAAMVSMLSVFLSLRWYWNRFAIEPEEDPVPEPPFETEFRRWCEGDPFPRDGTP